MRYRKPKNYKDKLIKYYGSVVIESPENCKGRWRDVFGNDNPIYVEAGMGKGNFLMEHAARNPHVNYIGIEKIEPLLIGASERVQDLKLSNIRLLSINANFIEDYFEESEVSGIYLNFSDPWPKARHHRRRLTSRCFLSKYTEVLNESKSLIFKTDNRNLFEFTLLELSARKDSLISVDLDLHSKDFEPDDERLILTEYEKRFMAQKLPIYRLEAQLLGNNRL